MRKFTAILILLAVISTACGQRPGAEAEANPETTTTIGVAPTTTSTTTTIPPTTTSTSTTTTTTLPPTTTTMPPFSDTPQWCNRLTPVIPGEFAVEDRFKDYVGGGDWEFEYGFIFVRVLEILGYEEVSVEVDSQTYESKLWRIRASIYEMNGLSYEGEFVIGQLVAFSEAPLAIESRVHLDQLTSARVSFDTCIANEVEREKLYLRSFLAPTDIVAGEVLEVGKVYGVGVIILDNRNDIPFDDVCPENDNYWCEFYRGTVTYNRNLFNAIAAEEDDLEAIENLEGWGWINRIFVPAGWYEFENAEQWYPAR